VRLALLEERLTTMRGHIDELRSDVDELLRDKVVTETVARQITSRYVASLRTRELAIAAMGLALTALNVAISVWAG